MADKQVSGLTSSTPTIDDLTISYDNADTSELKKTTWQLVRDLFKTYFDTVYQATLVSGTNIKTINSTSILGSGDIVISGGGSVATDAIWDSKGDLAGGTGANTASRLAVGTNGQVLTADSAEVTGMKWTTVSGTGDVTASAVIADNAIVRGDGGAKGVQSSGVTISDVNNISANNYFASSATTASAAGTTTLTVGSARIQNLTGATTQTFQLPDATTLALSSVFEFNNNSSGSLTITNAGAVSQYVIPAGGAVIVICTSIGTANGTWDFHALAPASVTWGSGIVGLVMNSVLSTSPSVASGASSATVPSFIPQRGASTTGFGGDGTSLFGIVGGFARFAINATGIGFANVANTFTSYFSNTATASRTWTLPDSNTIVPIISQILTFSGPTAARTITLPDANFTVARTDAANTFTGVQTTTQVLSTNNAITASGNAATVPVTSKTNTVTNNSAATLTITLTTAGAIDGQLVLVRVLDFSAVAQTVAWVNTENGEGTAFTTSNGSTTLPRTAGFQFNGNSSKWRCLTN